MEFDFSRPLAAIMGDPECAIDHLEIIDLSDGDTDVTATLTDAAKNTTQDGSALIFVQGGIAGHRYKITVRVAGTDNGEVFELDAVLPVREI